jgi:hypothetical protein
MQQHQQQWMEQQQRQQQQSVRQTGANTSMLCNATNPYYPTKRDVFVA